MTSSCQIVIFVLLSIGVLQVPTLQVVVPDDNEEADDMMTPFDDYIDSMLKKNEELLKSMGFEDLPEMSPDASGEYFEFENDTNDEMQVVMDMMFKNQFADEITERSILQEKEDIYEAAVGKDRSKKSSEQEDRRNKQTKGLIFDNDELLVRIDEIMRKDRNATFRAVENVLVLEDGEKESYHPVIEICGMSIWNAWSTDKLLQIIPSEDVNDIQKNLQQYLEQNITKKIFRQNLKKYTDKVKCKDAVATVSPAVSDIKSFLAAFREVVKEGYAEESVIRDLEEKRITPDQVKRQLMRNQDFVLSRFPAKLAEMLKDERIPDHIQTVMFSGNHDMEELKFIIYQDDSISKALLPERIREILENRNPPDELKDFLYQGHNHSVLVKMVLENETLVQEMMSESMYYFYNLFKVPRNVALNMALSGTTILALCCVMTSLGCTMTVTKIMQHVRRPKGVLIALLSQYGIMPAAAFGLTQAFNLEVYPAIAVLICGCCPGGNLSNILAFAINGDMNLSILMTTCSSVFGLAMMPFLLFCYSRFIIPIDGAEIVPFDKIILNIALTIVPVGVGIAIKHYRPTWTKNVMKFGAVMLVLCSITFSVIAGFLLGDKFFSYFPMPVVACAAILPMTGYVLGFVFARIVRENQQCSRTISVETGCQNVQLCGTVLKLAFDPILIGAVMLLPIIYMAFQAGEAFLLISIYRVYERCTKKKKEGDKDEENKVKFDDEEKKLGVSDSEDNAAEEEKEDNRKKIENKSIEKCTIKSKCYNGNNEHSREDCLLVPKPDGNFMDALERAKENRV